MIEFTVARRAAEPAPGGYTENAFVWFVDEDRDELVFGERLDPATDLPAIDADVAAPVEPEGGWDEGTILVDGRPVRRLPFVDNAMRMNTRSPAARAIAGRRRGTTRASRSRSSRRSRAPSRDGPSDEGEGDGEGPPPPAPSDVADERCERAPSNSQCRDVVCPPWSVSGYGIDTVALGWRDAVAAALSTIAQSGLIDAASGRPLRGVWQGRHLRLAFPVAGITLGVYPGLGLVTADARVASMLAGHDGDSALVAPERLRHAVDGARAALVSVGVCVAGPAVVRRLDLAGELWFPRASDGLMFLCACQRVLQLPRLAQRDYYARGEQRLESLAWQTPKGNQTKVRIYDSGAKRGTAEAGQRLRVERQCRWHGERTQTTEQVLAGDLSAMFCGPMRSWLVGAPTEIVMAGPSAAVADLLDRVRRDEIPRRRAEALIGKLTMLASGRDLLGPKDRQRREQDLRHAGVALDVSGDPHGATVDLRSPLVALAELWRSA